MEVKKKEEDDEMQFGPQGNPRLDLLSVMNHNL